jgi:hypothetical protein
MKHHWLPIIIFFAARVSLHAATLKGKILENQLGGAPIPSVSIAAEGANPQVTDNFGRFIFEFPLKHPGEKVQLTVSKLGYVVVNDFQLELILPSDADENLVTILLSKEAEREEWAARFIRVQLPKAVTQYPALESKNRLYQPGQSASEVQQRTYEDLAKQLGIDPKVLQEKLPKFAEELKNNPDISTFERANAAYVAKDYNEAERLALAAADEAKKTSPPKTSDAIRALDLAGASADPPASGRAAPGHGVRWLCQNVPASGGVFAGKARSG